VPSRHGRRPAVTDEPDRCMHGSSSVKYSLPGVLENGSRREQRRKLARIPGQACRRTCAMCRIRLLKPRK